MAVLMLKNNHFIHIKATEIRLAGEYVNILRNKKLVAIFRGSEIIGCWLDEVKYI